MEPATKKQKKTEGLLSGARHQQEWKRSEVGKITCHDIKPRDGQKELKNVRKFLLELTHAIIFVPDDDTTQNQRG